MIISSSPTGGNVIATVKKIDANIANIGNFVLIVKISSDASKDVCEF